MSKVKLIVNNRNTLDYGEVTEIVLSLKEGQKVVGSIETDFEANSQGERQTSDNIDPVIYIEDINNLIGRVKTLIDASTSDAEQRKATKDVFNNEIWSWYTGRTETLGRTWRFDKGYESRVAIPTKQ